MIVRTARLDEGDGARQQSPVTREHTLDEPVHVGH
jgi:hypothetical protein